MVSLRTSCNQIQYSVFISVMREYFVRTWPLRMHSNARTYESVANTVRLVGWSSVCASSAFLNNSLAVPSRTSWSCSILLVDLVTDWSGRSSSSGGNNIPLSRLRAFPKRSCVGDVLIVSFTEAFRIRWTNGIILWYPSIVALSNTNARICLLTSLLHLPTIAFSCEQYANVRLCLVPTAWRNSWITLLAKWGPLSERMNKGAP